MLQAASEPWLCGIYFALRVFCMIKLTWSIMAATLFLSPHCFASDEQCRLIFSTKERMACFDNETAANLKRGKHQDTQTKHGSTDAIQMTDQENELLDKQMKAICRGC